MKEDLKILPHSEESEIAILGSLMLDNSALYICSEYINGESFYNLKHKLIYETISEMILNNTGVDLVTLAEYLNKKKKLEQVGGAGYLSQIIGKVPTAANIEIHCQIVSGRFLKRELINISSKLLNDAYDESIDEFDMISDSQTKLNTLTEQITSGNIRHIKEIAFECFDNITALQEGKISYIKTPNRLINYLLRGGAKQSKLYGIPALTGQGKSAYIVNWISLCAENYNTLLYTLEMPAVEFVERITANKTGIDTYKMEGFEKKLSQNELEQIADCFSKYKEMRLWIDDRPSWNIDKLRLDIKKNVKKYKIQILFIDHMQLLHANRNTINTREQEITYIANELKAIARENKIPVVVAIQFNRTADKQRPRLSFLRESGAIEQAIDVCLALYDYTDHDINDSQVPYELIILKQRGGKVGNEFVIYDKSLFRFESKQDGYLEPPKVEYFNEPKEVEIENDDLPF